MNLFFSELSTTVVRMASPICLNLMTNIFIVVTCFNRY